MIAICPLSLVPVRKEPSDRSEMTTQLIFGDLVELVTAQGNWQEIRILDDGYTGWVDKKQLEILTDEEALLLNSSPFVLSTEAIHTATCSKGGYLNLVAGSRLPYYQEKEFTISNCLFLFAGKVCIPSRPTSSNIVSCAMSYLHAPYLWGGKSPLGIDCSGFTQMVYKLNGISLPRDAWQQALIGEPVATNEPTRTGDLAFFVNDQQKVVHVGLLLDDQRIIHASGKVRIDTLDHQGILNVDTNQYSHQLFSIRRFF